MTLANLYLICFVAGTALSLISFAMGALHVHLPVKLHGARAGGPRHVSHVSKGSAAGHLLTWMSPPGIFAFLAWFGGTGYLLTQNHHFLALAVLGLATTAGCVAEGILWWFLVKTLMPHESVLNEADYELVGTIAKVTSGIREGGTGEIIFSQGGVRRCAVARGNAGKPLERGREVVIARVDKGIAYVTPWEDWAK